jgi:acetylornithine deacetylase/succinyl-diaminopimelate desuccinylase-like protein
MTDWVEEQKVPGLTVEVLHDEGRTPLIYLEVQGEGDANVMLYGHMDKQPHMTGWNDGFGPCTPVIVDGKLYGRGGADDGYAIYGAVTAIRALKEQKIPHARCCILIEGCEESGSADLPYYIDKLTPRMGDVSLVVCLDSGCGNYDQLWLTGSLRGCIAGDLKVDILTEGVHSGSSSGIVPSSFRIMRQLLDRIEDAKTGQLLVPEAYCEIPAKHHAYAEAVAKVMGPTVISQFPFVEGAQPMVTDLAEALLNRTWRPTVSYTGMRGLPDCGVAGNVLRTSTTLKLSVRTPPALSAQALEDKLREVLEADPPYNAKVSFTAEKCGQGWAAPALHPWLESTLEDASNTYWGAPMMLAGEGGSIPFMAMLGHKFPNAQFVVTGVLGPASNAHGPNEFLHIAMGKKVTSTVSNVLANHFLNV